MGEDAEDERYAEEVTRDDEVIADDDHDDSRVHVVSNVTRVPHVIVQSGAHHRKEAVRDGDGKVKVQEGIHVSSRRGLKYRALEGLAQDEPFEAHAHEKTGERAEQPRHRRFSRTATALQTLMGACRVVKVARVCEGRGGGWGKIKKGVTV